MSLKNSGRLRKGTAAFLKTAGRGSLSVAGICETVLPGDYEAAKAIVSDLKAIGAREVLLKIPIEKWGKAQEDWYGRLLPGIAGELRLIPSITSPEKEIFSGKKGGQKISVFTGFFIEKFGRHFEYIELAGNPMPGLYRPGAADNGLALHVEDIGKALKTARDMGKKAVLGGIPAYDSGWLDLLCATGLVKKADAIDLDALDAKDADLCAPVREAGRVLKRHGLKRQVWATAGRSTVYNEFEQAQRFLSFTEAKCARKFWAGLYDRKDADTGQPDTRGPASSLGMKKHDGAAKLLYRCLSEKDLSPLRTILRSFSTAPRKGKRERHALITGGAGFIGANLARRLLSSGIQVTIYDNLSRPGVEKNLRWLLDNYGSQVTTVIADVRDRDTLRQTLAGASQVYHLAAQVAVTKSITGPVNDFSVNASGTLALLEELRALEDPPFLLFTSTNKVYGALKSMALKEGGLRYEPVEGAVRYSGVNEQFPLDFHSPYGCSKGTADQYVIDYARTYGIPATVFRMSCIYGPRQFGTEDQGWVAYFLIKALEDSPITIYGDGMQVRDILFIDDLVNAFLLARDTVDKSSGQVFNMGGGPSNSVSLLELIGLIEEVLGRRPKVFFDMERLGDQKYFVADSAKFRAATGWAPVISVEEGVARLYRWLAQSGRIPARRTRRKRAHQSAIGTGRYESGE